MEASEGALRGGWVRGDKELEIERKGMNSRNTWDVKWKESGSDSDSEMGEAGSCGGLHLTVLLESAMRGP